MSGPSNLPIETQRRIRRTALISAGVAAGMVGLAYASVPLYSLFCKVTGFGGTPIVRTVNAGEVLDRTIAIRFDSNVAPGLNWRFTPESPEVNVRIGETTTVYYRVQNVGMTLGIMPVTGLPMPFISYGGSSLITYFAMFGLVQSVHMRRMR